MAVGDQFGTTARHSTYEIGQRPTSSGIFSQSQLDGMGERRRSQDLERMRQDSYEAKDLAPTKKQRFEILRKLGSGTYGKVSLAMDRKNNEEVAVKVIRKSAIENTADLIRIRREIRIMSGLRHPNIIEIKEVFENDEKIIIIMEYASGGELYDYVSNQGPLPEDEVRRLFRQIVSAVFYCHKHCVVHRDLKLENILLDKGMGAKIADFGLSNYFHETSLLRTFCGSPLYASPEIINGTPYHGPEVDCWSLGVLLYTLAYSSMPFDGRDFNRMIRQIKRGAYYEPDPPSSASMLIRSMLRVNPDRRATVDDIAAHWWLNFDENQPSIADLPENQVTDSTPLYIRQETLMIQNFGEDNEVFAEFTHLSESTRKKIEEFRRRRKEAEWYLMESQSPIKKQLKKRSSSVVNDQKRQSSQAILAGQKQSSRGSGVNVRGSGVSNNVRGSGVNVRQSGPALAKEPPTPTPVQPTFNSVLPNVGEDEQQLSDSLQDPLNRLKALENRLHGERDQPPTRMLKLEESAEERDEMLQLARQRQQHHQQQRQQTANVERTPTGQVTAAQLINRPSSIVGLKETSAPSVATAQASSGAWSPMKTETKSVLEQQLVQQQMQHDHQQQQQQQLHVQQQQQQQLLDQQRKEKQAQDEAKQMEVAVENATAASLVSVVVDEANRLINQLMEEALRGTVSQYTIDTIRNSEAYVREPFVKEILDSVVTAQQPRPMAGSGSTSGVRTSRSKQQSVSRMSTLNAASPTPLPDLVSPDGDQSLLINGRSSSPPPDLVTDGVPAVIPMSVSLTLSSSSSSSAQPVSVPVAPVHDVIHDTVPEETELESTAGDLPTGSDVIKLGLHDDDDDDQELAHPNDQSIQQNDQLEPTTIASTAVVADDGQQPEVDGSDAESEVEEDVYSTDFEDLGTDEEDEELARVSGHLHRPQSDDDEEAEQQSPHQDDEMPISATDSCSYLSALPEIRTFAPTDVALAMLDEPFLRGLVKRLSRGKYERSKFIFGRDVSIEESPRGSRRRIGGVQPETKDAPQLFLRAKQLILQYPDPGRSSPEKERGPETAEEPLDPVSRRNDWLKTADPDLGSSQEIDSPPASPNPDTKYHYPDSGDQCPAAIDGSSVNHEEPPAVVVESKPEVNGDRSLDVYEPVSLQIYPTSLTSAKNSQLTDQNDRRLSSNDHLDAHSPQGGGGNHAKKRTYVSAGEAKSVGAVEPPLLQTAPKTRRSSVEPLLDMLEAGGRLGDFGSTTSPVDQKRHSYRLSSEHSLSVDRSVIDSASNLTQTTGVDGRTGVSDDFRSDHQKHQTPSSTTATSDPYWLQYAREETHRYTQPSYYGHGDYAGDGDRSRLMSPISASGYDRYDDDNNGGGSKSSYGAGYHQSQAASGYRSGSVYSSRDISPVRSLVSPFGGDTDDHQSIRRNRSKSWYQSNDRQNSFDDGGGSSSTGRPGWQPEAPSFEPVYTRRTTAVGGYLGGGGGGGGADNHRRSIYDPQPTDDDWRNDSARKSQFRVFQPKGLAKRRSRSLEKPQSSAYSAMETLGGGLMSTSKPPVLLDEPSPRASYYDTGISGAARRYESLLVGGGGGGATATASSAAGRSLLSDSAKHPSKSILKRPIGGLTSTSATPSSSLTSKTSVPKSNIYSRYTETEIAKQAISNTTANNAGVIGNGKSINFIERLRRHLSTDKLPSVGGTSVTSSSTSPSASTTIDSLTSAGGGGGGGVTGRTGGMSSISGNGVGGTAGSSAAMTSEVNKLDSTGLGSAAGQRKKRSVLDLNRRRTTEIRYGDDFLGTAGAGAGGLSSATARRATSPIEKIKGFFGGSTRLGRESTPTTATYNNSAYSSYATPGSNYVSSYRKPYQSSYRAHAYTPLTRYWYEDATH